MTCLIKFSVGVITGLSTLIFSTPSYAQATSQERPQTRPSNQADTGWTLLLGGGVAVSPNYLGDDSYSVSTLPYIRVTKGDRFFASVQEGMGYAVIKNGPIKAGPLASVEFGRDADGDGPFRVAGSKTDDLLGLGDINTTVSLGGFAEIDFNNITLSGKIGQALGGHDGLTGDIGLRYKGVLTGFGPPLIYSFGPSVDFGDTTYTKAYFGVTDQQSTNSGLTPYSASGGATRMGLSANGVMPLTNTLSANIVVSVSRLLGDAADSSLVTERGSRDQAFGGIFLARKF